MKKTNILKNKYGRELMSWTGSDIPSEPDILAKSIKKALKAGGKVETSWT